MTREHHQELEYIYIYSYIYIYIEIKAKSSAMSATVHLNSKRIVWARLLAQQKQQHLHRTGALDVKGSGPTSTSTTKKGVVCFIRSFTACHSLNKDVELGS